MNAPCRLLTPFYLHQWDANLSRPELAKKFRQRQVRKEILTHLIDRNDGFAIVLGHE